MSIRHLSATLLLSLIAAGGCDHSAGADPQLSSVSQPLVFDSCPAGQQLHPVTAWISASFTSAGCASPIGLCTAGTIRGVGPLDGATFFTTYAAAPSAGMPAVEPATTLSYAGQLVITTAQGSLTISDVGVFDQARLMFSEIDRVSSGTGLFAGASGRLFSFGDAPNGTGFEGPLVGSLCY